MLFGNLRKLTQIASNKPSVAQRQSIIRSTQFTHQKRNAMRAIVRDRYRLLRILRKKLKLGKMKFQANTTEIGSIQIFNGFKLVLPSSAAEASTTNLSDIYSSLHTSFLKNWHRNLFRLIILVCGLYLFYSFIVTVFLQLFFWDNIDFTPLLVKYPGILQHPTLNNYFFPTPTAVPRQLKRFPMEFLAIFALDI